MADKVRLALIEARARALRAGVARWLFAQMLIGGL